MWPESQRREQQVASFKILNPSVWIQELDRRRKRTAKCASLVKLPESTEETGGLFSSSHFGRAGVCYLCVVQVRGLLNLSQSTLAHSNLTLKKFVVKRSFDQHERPALRMLFSALFSVRLLTKMLSHHGCGLHDWPIYNMLIIVVVMIR